MIILDSDIMIDLLRQYPSAIAWLNSLGDEELLLSGFVVMELLQGCSTQVDQNKVEKILWPFRYFLEKSKQGLMFF